ncbi:MAG: AtpZ/AtpI family protein [Planctomycetes bacterium]|nr:AtpZ/AtpI family protein [Planctomycetota bacterium]
MSQQPTPRELGYYAALAQVGMEMVLPAVAGFYLDDWLGTSPWIMVALAVFGFAGSLIHLFSILRQKARDESSDTKPPP